MSEQQAKTSPEEARILDMLASKKISAREADELLSALRRPTRILSWFYHPHATLNTKWSLMASLVAAAVAMGLSRVGIVFDGVLDLHRISEPHSWFLTVLETLVAWPMFALCLMFAAKTLGSRGRFVDFFVTVGVARLPLVLGGVLLAFFVEDMPNDPEVVRELPMGIVILLSSIMIPVLFGFVMWLWQGFALASGRRDGKAVAVFVVTIVVSEIASKAILALMA